MSGKEHVSIGFILTLLFSLILVYLKIKNIGIWMIIITLGAVIGSYVPDIDSKKSKASQYFNNILCYSLVILFIVKYLNINLSYLTIIQNKLNIDIKNILPFIIVLFLGKLSPHRQFTHKIIGTIMMILSIYIIGNDIFTLGFIIGYVLHILADKTTKNGKYLNFFEIKLPMQTSKNKFCI